MTLRNMVHFLHILIALVLIVPVGLLEHAPDLLDCAGSSFVLEDGDFEDAESLTEVEFEKHWLSNNLINPRGLHCLVLPVFPMLQPNLVEVECTQLRGCRPPPTAAMS